MVGSPTQIRASEDSDVITDIQASPDGRFIATANAAGELAVLDLQHPGALPIHSKNLNGGFAWSPDSKRLVFSERFPGEPTAIWILQPAEGRDRAPLVGGFDWKARPGWIDTHRVVYLSDRESDHVNVWSTETETSATQKLLDRGRDVSGLWVSPARGEFIYRSAERGVPELWWYWDRSPQPVQISRDPTGEFFFEDLVSFSADGHTVAYVSESSAGDQLVCFDLGRQIQTSILKLEAAPDSLLVKSEEEILVAVKGQIHTWEPKRRGSPLSPGADWNGAAVTHPARLGEGKWAAAANGALLITFDNWKKLDQGHVQARQPRDLIRLAQRWETAEHPKPAVTLLDDLLESKKISPEDQFLLAATRAWIERKRGKEKRADEWLNRALETITADRSEADAIWHARLLMKFFDEGDADGARGIIDKMPQSARDHPRGVWTNDLLHLDDAKLRKKWQSAGKALREGQWQDAAVLLREMIMADPNSTIHRRGVAFLLQGDLEPLDELIAQKPVQYPNLLKQFRFQEALVQLSNADLSKEFTKRDLRELLLSQWAEAGQLEAAKNLVAADLRDPDGSSFDYEEIITRYLDAEEQEKWLLRAVNAVLLSPQVAQLLDRQMSDTKTHLLLSLARAKGAYIQSTQGKAEDLVRMLGQIERDLGIIPASFWTPTTARLFALSHIFKAKYYELNARWDDAIAEYDRTAEIIDHFEREWGMLPFDVALARETIETGQQDPDLLRTYLQTVRELGDPLVNPTRDRAALTAGLMNLRALRAHASDPWIRPLIDYREGNAFIALGEPYRAADFLQRARGLHPPKALSARIYIDEAAVRGTLGQHYLEAGLLGKASELGLDSPQLTVTIHMRAQAEKGAGLIESEENRMRFLCHELKLPRPWAAVLIADHTVLPLEMEGKSTGK